VQILKENGVQVEYHTVSNELGLSDSIFVHDPAFITDKGAIVCKTKERSEERKERGGKRREEGGGGREERRGEGEKKRREEIRSN